MEGGRLSTAAGLPPLPNQTTTSFHITATPLTPTRQTHTDHLHTPSQSPQQHTPGCPVHSGVVVPPHHTPLLPPWKYPQLPTSLLEHRSSEALGQRPSPDRPPPRPTHTTHFHSTAHLAAQCIQQFRHHHTPVLQPCKHTSHCCQLLWAARRLHVPSPHTLDHPTSSSIKHTQAGTCTQQQQRQQRLTSACRDSNILDATVDGSEQMR